MIKIFKSFREFKKCNMASFIGTKVVFMDEPWQHIRVFYLETLDIETSEPYVDALSIENKLGYVYESVIMDYCK